MARPPINSSITPVILHEASQFPESDAPRPQPEKTSSSAVSSKSDNGNPALEFVISRIISDGTAADYSLLYRVQWHDYRQDDDLWEPIKNLPRSHIVRYHDLRNLPLPPDSLL